jgi:serine/threonine-protein kinase
VILYEALSGRQPFKAESHHAVLHRILGAEPAPLPEGVHPALRFIVARCLQKDRTRRYPNAAALRADLEAALAGVDLAGPVWLPSQAAPARVSVATAPIGIPAAARAQAGSDKQTLAWLGALRRTATMKWSGAWSRVRGSGCEETLESAPRRRFARSWTALGFAGGVTAAAAIGVSLMHSEPAEATTRTAAATATATVARQAAPAVVAGLAEAARRAGGAALASAAAKETPAGCADGEACAGAMPRPATPVAALPEGQAKEAGLQGQAPEASSGSAQPAMEERSSSTPRRRRRGVTWPGF